MTSIKGQYFRACALCRKFHPFIEVIKYEPEDFSCYKDRFLLLTHKDFCKYDFYTPICRTIFCLYRSILYY